jgi:ribosomal protein S19E (S16A)
MKALSLTTEKIWPMLSFGKVGQTSRSRPQGKKLWYQKKALIIRNTYMKYESPITYHFKRYGQC